MDKNFVVYLTTYYGNKMPMFYIGYSYNVKERKYYGTPSSKQYKNIWKEELKNNPQLFKIKILKEFSNNIKQAKKYETYIQSFYNVHKNSLFINMCIQHENYYSIAMTEENKKLLSKLYKDKTYEEIYGIERAENEKYKRKISNTGKTRTKEQIEKMVLSKLGFTHSEETKKRLSELNPYKNIGFFTGRKHTEESKAKIGEKSKGRIKSKEELEKLSLAHMNKKLSDSTKNKISEFNKTKVINGEHKFLKISSVDINGNCVFVSSDIFYNEKCKDVEERLYVGITSKEGIRRRKLKEEIEPTI